MTLKSIRFDSWRYRTQKKKKKKKKKKKNTAPNTPNIKTRRRVQVSAQVIP